MTLQKQKSGSGPARRALRSHAGFRWLVGSDAAETLGDSTLRTITPLIAISMLGAGAMSVSLLNALGLAAFLIFGVPAGVWVDRWNKKKVLVLSTSVRALLVISLPLAYLFNLLSLPFLLLVVGVLGIADVLFTTAHAALLPATVGKHLVSPATATLESVRSSIGLAAPALTGLLLKLLSAPLALWLNGLSYVLSALFISRVTFHPETSPAPRENLWREARQGFSHCLGNRYLRAFMISSLLVNAGAMFGNAASAVFALNHLGITPAGFALAGTASALGGLFGSLIAPMALRRFGLGKVKLFSSVCALPLLALYPLAGALPGPPITWLLLTNLGWASSVVIHSVAGADVIPRLSPGHMLARVTATNRFYILGAMPLASLLGGAMATWFGPVSALWGWVLLAGLAALPIAFSPIRSWQQVPESFDDGQGHQEPIEIVDKTATSQCSAHSMPLHGPRKVADQE